MDLTQRAQRSPYHIGVLGMMNTARMADKARARLSNTLGEYKAGQGSGRDQRTLTSLGLSEDTFLEIVEKAQDDQSIETGIRAVSNINLDQIKAFNAVERDREPPNETYRRGFEERKLIVGQPEIITMLDMCDAEDIHDFGVPFDLTIGPPLSAHSGGILGIVCLGRLISKTKAFLNNTLSEYKFGANSGLDINTMKFLDLTETELIDGVGHRPDLPDLLKWLRSKISKSPHEITDWNRDRRARGPWNEEIQKMFDDRAVAVGRTDLTTFLDLLDCEDANDYPQ